MIGLVTSAAAICWDCWCADRWIVWSCVWDGWWRTSLLGWRTTDVPET